MEIASFSEETSKAELRWVESSSLRKKTGGLTSLSRAEFCMVQRRTKQRSQSTRVDLLNLGEVKNKYAETIELLDAAAEIVQCGSADHASRAAHDGYVLYAFDLVLKFHIFIHTNQPSEKFRSGVFLFLLSLNLWPFL